MADEFRTQTEDVILRFRTTRPLGLLLVTNTEQSADKLELALMGGRVRLMARMGDREKVRLRLSLNPFSHDTMSWALSGHLEGKSC
jgi:leucine-rich repeat transmembrane neuronal protein 1/2